MGFKDRQKDDQGEIWNEFTLLVTEARFEMGDSDNNKSTVYLAVEGDSPDLPLANAHRTIRWSMGKHVVPAEDGTYVTREDGSELENVPGFCTLDAVLAATPDAVLDVLDAAGPVGQALTWVGLTIRVKKITVTVGKFDVKTYVIMEATA